MTAERVSERVKSCATKRCSGFGWFVVRWPFATTAKGYTEHTVCASCVARARVKALAAKMTIEILSVVLHCPSCGHNGSHADSGREWCSSCGYEHETPR